MVMWKIIPEFPEYEVSDQGDVRRRIAAQGTSSGKLLKPYDNGNGYLKVQLVNRDVKKRATVHRLVLQTFCGPAPRGKTDCAHLNGIRSDNRLSNLKWKSRAENMLDAKIHGTSAMGERNGHAKLTQQDVLEMRNLRKNGKTFQSIADTYSVSRSAASDAIKGKNWGHIVCEDVV